MTLIGGCLCGEIRYQAQGPARGEAVCHCRHCQKQSGSAFSVLVAVDRAGLVLAGEPACFVDLAESGRPVRRYFCPACGSPLYSATEDAPQLAYLKAGTLDDVSALRPRVHVWCDSAWPWTPFPEGAVRIARNPG